MGQLALEVSATPTHPAELYTPPSALLFQNIPTLGSVAVTMALHGCDEVAVAGFGYDMNTPNAPLHYYETVRMAAIQEVRAGRGGKSLGGAGGRGFRREGRTPASVQIGRGSPQLLLPGLPLSSHCGLACMQAAGHLCILFPSLPLNPEPPFLRLSS